MKHIVLTGGGTAGHVTPNIALMERLAKEGYKISYIGSYDGMEKDLIKDTGVNYYGISCGKLRRYFDKKNFSDVFKVIKGIGEAKKILKKLKPNVVFSKGGFVCVPVVIAAKSLNIPVILHESDFSPGLANKIAMPFASKICLNFPEALENVPKEKAIVTGTPIRSELFSGDKHKGKALCSFTDDKDVLLIMGGSQGSVFINNIIRDSLDSLLMKYNIIHICGKGNLDSSLENKKGYKQFEYVKDELKDLLALCDIVVSRSGANAISEFLALKKPALLIPLSRNASRGDQILNAKSYERQGFCLMSEEEELTKESLLNKIDYLQKNKTSFIENMDKTPLANGVKEVMKVINEIK